MQKIAIVNQKGGVGKTTSVNNIGAGLVSFGKKVMLIDLDAQSNLTYSLGLDAEMTIYDVLKGDVGIQDIIIEKGALHIIPASLTLSGAEIELSSIAGREFLLSEALADIQKNYDYILIDCPPSLSLLTLNALTTANEVYIPIQTEFLALKGVSMLIDTIEVIKKRLNKKLEITGIIGTRYNKHINLNNEVLAKIKEHFETKLFKTLIRENVALAEAPSHKQNIFEYKSNSNGAEDYLNLCKEIIKRG